jgi:hypothetical protein
MGPCQQHHYTAKILGGVTPVGDFAFVSTGFGGRIADPSLTEKSGLLELVEAGDVFPADKGFLINGLLREPGAKCSYPPKRKKGQEQLTALEGDETSRQANLRCVRVGCSDHDRLLSACPCCP